MKRLSYTTPIIYARRGGVVNSTRRDRSRNVGNAMPGVGCRGTGVTDQKRPRGPTDLLGIEREVSLERSEDGWRDQASPVLRRRPLASPLTHKSATATFATIDGSGTPVTSMV